MNSSLSEEFVMTEFLMCFLLQSALGSKYKGEILNIS